MRDLALKPGPTGPTARPFLETDKRQAAPPVCDACAASPGGAGSCCGSSDGEALDATNGALGHHLGIFRTLDDRERPAEARTIAQGKAAGRTLQRKPADGAACEDGACEAETGGEEEREAVLRKPLPHAVATPTANAVLAGPDDPLEQSADRAADAALQRMATAGAAHPAPSAMAGPESTLGPLQRAQDPDEAEADAAADAGAEPELEPPAGEGEEGAGDEGPPDGTDGEDVQAKQAAGFRPGLDLPTIHARIDTARPTGRAIAEPMRHRLEAAFGADFSAVRVHADAQAAALAAGVHALAFTSGRDVFFGAGRYDPASQAGQRLLAHELAHVIQQRAARSMAGATSVAAPYVVQRQPAPGQALTAALYLLDSKDELIAVWPLNVKSEVKAPPGLYEVTLKPAPGGYQLSVVGRPGYGTHELKPKNLKMFAADLKQARSARLLLAPQAPPGTDPAKTTPPSGPTGPAGPRKEKKEDQPGPGGEEQKEEKTKEDKKDAKDEKEQEKKGEKDKPGGQTPGTGTGPGVVPGQGGSKYGWLGVFSLPEPLARALETIIDALGDGDEIIAFRETVETVRAIATHSDQLQDLFKDPETLLEIALGLKQNDAIDKIQAWAEMDTPEPKPARDQSKSGIVGLAAKILRMVRRVRRLLKPVFKVRGTVQSAIGAVGLMMEAIPALEHLIELTKSPTGGGGINVRVAIEQVAGELGEQLRGKLDGIPAVLKHAVERLADQDFVTYEEIARAITAAIIAGLPKTYRWIGKAARHIGLERAIADNVVVHIVPKPLFETVNGTVRAVFKLAQPTLDGAVADLTKIVAELDTGLKTEMPAMLQDLLKPDAKPGGTTAQAPRLLLPGAAPASPGEPLDDGVRTAAQTRLGHSFAEVRVHRDVAANDAAERLNANAFTIGSHVYFGPGRFAPGVESGRRLLDHELTHVAQQADPRHGTDVQFDYKDLLARLAKRVSAAALKELKGATAPSAAKRKEAEEIKNKVEKLKGRPVVSRTNPALPTGYTYVPKTGPQIKTIRRSLAWIRFIPALKIDKNHRIQLTAALSSFDPKAAARAMLRRALGCSSTQEAHHVVPLEELLHPVVQAAVKNGWKFNGKDNGLCISNKIHSGSHGNYTANVRSQLNRLKDAFGTDWTKLEKPFRARIEAIKGELRKRRRKLD